MVELGLQGIFTILSDDSVRLIKVDDNHPFLPTVIFWILFLILISESVQYLRVTWPLITSVILFFYLSIVF